MQFNITYLGQKDFLFNTIIYLSLHVPSPPPFSYSSNCCLFCKLFLYYSFIFTVSVFIYTYHIQLFCDKFTKEKALDKTNLFFGLIHEPIMQLNYGQWLICFSISLFAVLYVLYFGSEINLNLKINLNLNLWGLRQLLLDQHSPKRQPLEG